MMMIVMRHTTVVTGKDEHGEPADMPLSASSLLIGEEPEAKHAKFLGFVRGMSLAFIAKTGPYET